MKKCCCSFKQRGGCVDLSFDCPNINIGVQTPSDWGGCLPPVIKLGQKRTQIAVKT